MKNNDPDYPATARYLGQHAEDYDARRSGKTKWKNEQKLTLSYIKTIPASCSVLDVPFGTGRFAEFYIEQSLQVTGVDISPDMIAAAMRNLGDQGERFDLRVGPAETLPFADGSFDYLICSRFIKWLPTFSDVENVFREFFRVTRREIFVQVKISRPTFLGKIADYLEWYERRSKSLISGKTPTLTTRYQSTQFDSIFNNKIWRVAEVIDGESVGPGVRYYRLIRRA